MKKNNRSFWLFFAIIAGFTGITVLINIYSPVSVKELEENTETNIEMIEENLREVQEKFDEYGHIMDRFAENNTDRSLLEEEIEAMEQELLLNNRIIQGTCYQISWEGKLTLEKYMDRSGIREVPLSEYIHISPEEGSTAEGNREGTWKRVTLYTNEECFLYIRPVFRQEETMGYAGMLLSTSRIREEIERQHGNFDGDYFIFVDETEAKSTFGAVDWEGAQSYFKPDFGNGEQIYTFKVLHTGMIYVEGHKEIKQIRYSNVMLLLVSIFAIAAMWIIQRKDRTGKTLFDRAADFVMRKYINEINTIQRQGYRATIALNIGMAAAIFADVVYSITLGRGIKTLAEYLLFLGLSCSVIILYKFSKTGITEKMAWGIIIAGLTGPMVEHIISGGFTMGRAGESFLWFIVCLYIALFILGTEKAVHVLSVFVVLLFLEVVLEILLYQGTNYEGSYLFAIGFILLGFALYNAMEIYVSGAASHYRQTKKLIKELKKNEDLLLKKEKLGALGQLISGVAHEINTPIGAIKASAETMDSLFLTMLEEILDTAGAFSSEEYEAFLELVSMSLNAKCEMKSTLEIRIAKKDVKKYFEEIGLKNRDRVSALLGELEIVDPDQIRERLELFQSERITDILERVTKLTAFTSGIPIVLYASDRVSQIVLALKSYVHTSSIGESVEFDLIRSIENVLILFRNQLKGNIKINKDYRKSPCVITGNPDELAQVWTNLIQNAIHAMQGGGVLTIKIDQPEGETVRVSVGDTGTGIAPELLGQIFEPFVTTKQNGEGNGLGLNISKKIIEKHHGTIEAESQAGRGTVFSICLNMK